VRTPEFDILNMSHPDKYLSNYTRDVRRNSRKFLDEVVAIGAPL
jgi:hypothetical protein